ncbi:MAG: Fe2+-dependent dioxygenase [Luteimonas sp.]
MLLHIPKILDREQLARFRSGLDRAEWIDGRQTVGAQGAQVKRNLQLADDSPVRRELGAIVLAALAKNPLYFASVLPMRTLAPRFNRYQDGGEYGLHVDGAVMALAPETGQPPEYLRSDVSCTLFLNNPEEYEGGGLVVDDTYGEHEVKLPAGDLIVYPSSSLHRVEPVTRGARLAAFFWVQSMVRDLEQRQMLYKLDTSIQSLTRSGADRDVLLQLTGIYHNLLRRWAET